MFEFKYCYTCIITDIGDESLLFNNKIIGENTVCFNVHMKAIGRDIVYLSARSISPFH